MMSIEHTGSVTFTRETVIGIIATDAGLDGSNDLGSPTTTYPSPQAAIAPDFDLNDDDVTLSSDRHTVTMHWEAGNPGDRIRILTTSLTCCPACQCDSCPCDGTPNDGDACTDDVCDPTLTCCVHPQANCDDGNACTTDICASGCVHTPTVDALPDGHGCIPPDADAAKCQKKVADATGKLVKCQLKCRRKEAESVLKGKPVDTTCEPGCRTKFDDKTSGLTGCPPCLSAPARAQIGDQAEAFVDNMSPRIYCEP
jgi:hypothetical protein